MTRRNFSVYVEEVDGKMRPHGSYVREASARSSATWMHDISHKIGQPAYTEVRRTSTREVIFSIGVKLADMPKPASTPTSETDLVEALARYAHESWSGWMQYMLPKLGLEYAEGETYIARWRRQMVTPYDQLPEREKTSDREEAYKIYKLIRSFERGNG